MFALENPQKILRLKIRKKSAKDSALKNRRICYNFAFYKNLAVFFEEDFYHYFALFDAFGGWRSD